MNGRRYRVEVMHGVNLDQLGRRDPLLYGTLTLPELAAQAHERLAIAVGAAAGDRREAQIADHRHTPPGLAALNVGQVDLQRGQRGDLERVPDRPRVVGPRARVEQDRIGPACERVQPLHEHALVIGVKEASLEPQLARMAFYLALELRQRERAIEQRIAPAELVEVYAVHDLDAIAAAVHP